MPSLPTARDLHVDGLLTDFAIMYGQDLAKDYVADLGATMKRVDKQSDKYAVFNKGDMYRSAMQPRADGEKSAGTGFRVDTSNSYFCDTFALHSYVTDRQKANSDLDIMKLKVRYLMQQAKLKRDISYGTDIFATGKWTSNTEQQGVASSASTNEFIQFNSSSSVPIEIIQNQILAVQASTGKMLNTMITNLKVLQALQRHSSITDLYKHTSPGIPSKELVAQALGVDRILVGNAVQNTAAEGATASMSRVFGNDILLVHVADAATDDDATAVTGFAWSEFDAVDATGATVSQWYDQDRRAQKLEIEQSFDFKITANDLGVFLDDAVA